MSNKGTPTGSKSKIGFSPNQKGPPTPKKKEGKKPPPA